MQCHYKTQNSKTCMFEQDGSKVWPKEIQPWDMSQQILRT